MTEYQTFGQLCSDKLAVKEYLRRKKPDEITRLREENERLREEIARLEKLNKILSIENAFYIELFLRKGGKDD